MNQVQAQLSKHKWLKSVLPVTLLLLVCAGATAYFPRSAKGGSTPTVTAIDPGPRPLPAGAGGFLPSLSANEKQIEPSITTEFNRVHDVVVTSPTDGGLGPRFNSNSCASCHNYPAVGGSSPPSNPLFSVYQLNGATNTMPFFNTATGPIVEARFINQPGTTIPMARCTRTLLWSVAVMLTVARFRNLTLRPLPHRAILSFARCHQRMALALSRLSATSISSTT